MNERRENATPHVLEVARNNSDKRFQCVSLGLVFMGEYWARGDLVSPRRPEIPENQKFVKNFTPRIQAKN
jgi:hypothetical protein